MSRQINNVKLGVFVMAGLVFLVLLLYMIGKNRQMFGSTYVLKARFENVQGLVAGNNVRFAGIQTGTIRRIKVLGDTVLEVTMLIDLKMKDIIRRNAVVSIGTEGFVGNKVVNIVPSREPAPLAEEGDILVTRKAVDTDLMLQTLSKTNNDISEIAAELKTTVQRLNNSSGLWALLQDKSVPQDVKYSISDIRAATAKASLMAADLQELVAEVKGGKGSLGAVLRDTLYAKNLNDAILGIKSAGNQADSLACEINDLVKEIRHEMDEGNGTVHALLKDSAMAGKINESLDNIKQGTDGFNESMEALKHNFLLRGYFRKQEKQKQKSAKRTVNVSE